MLVKQRVYVSIWGTLSLGKSIAYIESSKQGLLFISERNITSFLKAHHENKALRSGRVNKQSGLWNLCTPSKTQGRKKPLDNYLFQQIRMKKVRLWQSNNWNVTDNAIVVASHHHRKQSRTLIITQNLTDFFIRNLISVSLEVKIYYGK